MIERGQSKYTKIEESTLNTLNERINVFIVSLVSVMLTLIIPVITQSDELTIRNSSE